MLDWASSFSISGRHLLKQNTLLTTLPTLTKEWRVSFEFNPKNYDYRGYAQILQMTIGGKDGNVGDRTPSLWIHKTRGVYISTTLNGEADVGKLFRTKKPRINEWTTVEISQARKGSKYMFSLVIKGETLWSVENTRPMQFSNVYVYACSVWYVAQAGSIRGFKIENKMPGENKLLLVKFIYFIFLSVLTPQWSEWGECTKNRTRPDISCIASYSSDNCPMEVEGEGCSSPGNSCRFVVISVKLTFRKFCVNVGFTENIHLSLKKVVTKMLF